MGNPKVAGALATTAKWSCTIAAWYGGKYNGVVPASSGRVTWSTSRDVPGTISIEVPVKDQSGKVGIRGRILCIRLPGMGRS